MAIRLRRPRKEQLAGLLARCREDKLTYRPTGGSLGGVVPRGFHRRTWTTTLPDAEAFDRACDAIRGVGCAPRRRASTLWPRSRCAVGTNVAMSAPLPVGFVEITCRVVAIVDEPDRFGFAYGTLPVHPEQGEESFLVVA